MSQSMNLLQLKKYKTRETQERKTRDYPLPLDNMKITQIQKEKWEK